VVKNVGTAEQVADRLMELRVKAVREAFHEEDLSDGQLTVSLNTDPDVIFAVPIILPPQVCMVSLGSVQAELVLADGQVREQHHFTAGLTYDHRVINGHDAVEFLTAFKTGIERGEQL
jgi:pyruvate/2-oxoglutarate dehydrogenase complex dihydrolipoamide acyltransferase (E2) component